MNNLLSKCFIFLLFATLNVTSIFAFTDENPNQELPTEEIEIKVGTCPVDPGLERSLIIPVQVYLYSADKEIEVIFNRNLGNVCIQIVNRMGITVAGYECNTMFEPMVKLCAPACSGYYTIYIYGTSYQGVGTFNIN